MSCTYIQNGRPISTTKKLTIYLHNLYNSSLSYLPLKKKTEGRHYKLTSRSKKITLCSQVCAISLVTWAITDIC